MDWNEGYIERLEARRSSRGWHIEPPPSYGSNRFIEEWWGRDLDELLKRLVDEFGWGWHEAASTELLANIPDDVVDAWKAVDPLCKRYSYYNVLLNFAVARAQSLGYEDHLVTPAPRECALCEATFDERSLKAIWHRALGAEICGVCLAKALTMEGYPLASREESLESVKTLVEALCRIPPQRLPDPVAELSALPVPARIRAVGALAKRPSTKRTKELFGSWFHALIAAEVLDSDAAPGMRGTRCLAEDGHLCLSFGEKTIDDLLYRAGVPHEREPNYPEGGMRADFRIGSALVEYFGLAGDPEYEEKSERKRDLAKRHKIQLIEVLPEELANQPRLLAKLLEIAPPQGD